MKRGYSVIAIQDIIKNGNFGGVLRACGCYGADLLIIGGKFIKEVTDTQSAYKHIPVIQNADIIKSIPYDCIPIAVDLLPDATPLQKFTHPERAYYIFGHEAATLGKSITDYCKHKIYIPTKYCMNLAATVNVVLYDRMAKGKDTPC